jgi:hypothetical protein
MKNISGLIWQRKNGSCQVNLPATIAVITTAGISDCTGSNYNNYMMLRYQFLIIFSILDS